MRMVTWWGKPRGRGSTSQEPKSTQIPSLQSVQIHIDGQNFEFMDLHDQSGGTLNLGEGNKVPNFCQLTVLHLFPPTNSRRKVKVVSKMPITKNAFNIRPAMNHSKEGRGTTLKIILFKSYKKGSEFLKGSLKLILYWSVIIFFSLNIWQYMH